MWYVYTVIHYAAALTSNYRECFIVCLVRFDYVFQLGSSFISFFSRQY